MNGVFISPNTLLVSVPLVPSGGNSVASYIFPTQQQLQNRKILAVEAFCSQDMAGDPNNPGNVLLSATQLRSAFLTIYTSEWNKMPGSKQQSGLFYDKIPLCSLRRIQINDGTVTPAPSGVYELFRIRPTAWEFNKCKVEIPNSIALAANVSAVFLLHYGDLDSDCKEYYQ